MLNLEGLVEFENKKKRNKINLLLLAGEGEVCNQEKSLQDSKIKIGLSRLEGRE